jgi:hypothetical protein
VEQIFPVELPGRTGRQSLRHLPSLATFGQLRCTSAAHRLSANHNILYSRICQSRRDEERAPMKLFKSILLAIIFLILAGSNATRGNEKRAPLPSKILAAQTVFVDNQTTTAELQNTVYTELSKWGRLQIVDAPQKADFVLRLSNGNAVKFVPGGENGAAPAPQAAKNSFMGADDAVPPGSTRVSVIDPKTGNSVWSDIRKTNSAKVATHMLDGLREAFEQKK